MPECEQILDEEMLKRLMEEKWQRSAFDISSANVIQRFRCESVQRFETFNYEHNSRKLESCI